VDDSGLYERLHESEKRRKVAAILVDHMRQSMSDHMDANEDRPQAQMIYLGLGIGWSDTVLRALAGDFDYVKSTIPPGHELVARIGVVLGE
jgi:hypothetical protein